MKPDTFIAGVIAGIGLLLVIKYGVIGLDAWNSTFHPGRKDAPGPFSKPFLMGVASCNH
jgi:hypothetical protein